MSAPSNLVDDFSRAADLGAQEFEIALLISRLIHGTDDAEQIRVYFEKLIEPILAVPEGNAQWLLDWLQKQGFGTHKLQASSLQHSDIGWVLREHQGLPITLAVVLIECARRFGLESAGINFPGHFLVRVDQSLVDPLSMTQVDPSQLQRKNLEDGMLERLMQVATPQMLGLRMLNNIKAVLYNRRDWKPAIDLLDCQMALAGEDAHITAPIHFERGEIWEQLGAVSVARMAYEDCSRLSVSTDLTKLANERMAVLKGRDETLH